MADITIAALPAKTTWADTDIIIIQDGADTKKMTVAKLKELMGVALQTVGTFTPVIRGTISAGAGTYTTQVGNYVKIGKLVVFSLYLVWTTHTGTGNIQVAGLPFANILSNPSPVSISHNDITLTAGKTMEAWVSSGDSNINLQQIPTGGGVLAAVAMDAAGTLMISGCYITT